MDRLKLLKDSVEKENLINSIKDRILEFNHELYASSSVTVVANINKRKIYSLFIDYYVFHLIDVCFYELSTNEEFKRETIDDLYGFIMQKFNEETSYNLYELSSDYVKSIINIINFETIIKDKKLKYDSNYKKHLYSYILNDKRIINDNNIDRKMNVEKYKFFEVNNIVDNNFETDAVYLEVLSLTKFHKITPSAKEFFDYLNFSVQKEGIKKIYLELPVFEEIDELYPFLKITYPEDTVFIAENIPIFFYIGKALSMLKDIEVNVVIPMVDKERELDFIKRIITNNYEYKMKFHILQPYDVCFKAISDLKKYESLILDFTKSEVQTEEELFKLINECKDGIKDVRDSLIFRKEVCVKTNFLHNEKIINFFFNRGYRTFFFDRNSQQDKMIKEIEKIGSRRKTLKYTF